MSLFMFMFVEPPSQYHSNHVLITYWTTSQLVLICLKNLKQIQGCKRILKLSAYSDCSLVHCFEIPWSSCDDICGIRTQLIDHIFNHKSTNSCPFPKFQTDPRSRQYLETSCQLRFFPSPLLRNSIIHS